jgi:hypothetical protein
MGNARPGRAALLDHQRLTCTFPAATSSDHRSRPVAEHPARLTPATPKEITTVGYDMYIVQEADQAEKDALAAARAHCRSLASPWELPEGPERDAAQQAVNAAFKAADAAERSYFRLNIFGMSRYCGFMDKLGMLSGEDSPAFPRPEDHGLTEWPESDSDTLTDAEKAFLAACEAVTDYEPQPVTGIPVGKFGSNDGWLVTPAQCTAALESYRKHSGDEVKALTGPDRLDYWQQWIAFLNYASGRGGFRVH